MKAFLQFIALTWRYRHPIGVMTRQEILSRYAGSLLGFAWTITHPLVTIALFWFVFSKGFKVAPAAGVPFLSWFICAYAVWQTFSEALTASSQSLIRNQALIKKTTFPAQILPLVAVFSSLINGLVLLVLLLVVLVYQGIEFHFMAWQVLYYYFALLLLALGLGWLFSAAAVLVRDLLQVVQVILQVGFWATPIFYQPEIFGPTILRFLKLNPIFYLTEGFRNALLYNQPFWADPLQMAYFWVFTLLLLGLGGFAFSRLKPDLAENL